MATVKAAAKTERRQADVDLRAQVLLSVQRALLGCITADMRLISVEWSPFRIHFHVYVDGVDGGGVAGGGVGVFALWVRPRNGSRSNSESFGDAGP